MSRFETVEKTRRSPPVKPSLPRWTFPDWQQTVKPARTENQVIDVLVAAPLGLTEDFESALAQLPLVKVLSRLNDAQRALTEIEWRKPAVVLLGMGFVNQNDGEITSRIKDCSPNSKVVVLGETEDDLDKLVNVPKVDTYVPSGASPSELVEAIVRTAADTNDLSPSMLKLIRMKLDSVNQVDPRSQRCESVVPSQAINSSIQLNKPSRNKYHRTGLNLSPKAILGWMSLTAALIYALCHVPDTLSALMSDNSDYSSGSTIAAAPAN